MVLQDRQEAGKLLAKKLKDCLTIENSHCEKIVLAIPRGGVVVGKQLAKTFGCPLDVIVAKKIPAPGSPELAVGAVGTIGEPVIDEELATKVGAEQNYIKYQIANIKNEIKRREKNFRDNKPPLDLKDKIVILTDDGVATGATMMAAIEIVRQREPKKVIVAVPVVARDSLEKISGLADEVVYLQAPKLFFAVGQFYREFDQVSDEEVAKLLK